MKGKRRPATNIMSPQNISKAIEQLDEIAAQKNPPGRLADLSVEERLQKKLFYRNVQGSGALQLTVERDFETVENMIQYLNYCPPDGENKLGNFLREWNSRKISDNLDKVIKRSGITLSDLYLWTEEGSKLRSRALQKFRSAERLTEVMETHLNEAVNPEGIDDRNLFFRSNHLLPQPSGNKTNINVQQNNANAAKAEAGTSLPSFEDGRREIAEIVSADD